MPDDLDLILDADVLVTVAGGVSRNSAKPDRAKEQQTQQLLTQVNDSIKDLARNSSKNDSSSQLLPMMMMMGRR